MKGIIAIICIATLVLAISADLSLFSGKFQLVSSPNAVDYQELLKELGYGDSIRVAYAAAKQILTEITVAGNSWTASVTVDGKSKNIQFELGKEFDEDLIDGRKSKTTCTSKGANQIICTQNIVGGRTGVAVEEVTKEELKITHECNGKKAMTTWKRL